jgi:hypothetical protein
MTFWKSASVHDVSTHWSMAAYREGRLRQRQVSSRAVQRRTVAAASKHRWAHGGISEKAEAQLVASCERTPAAAKSAAASWAVEGFIVPGGMLRRGWMPVSREADGGENTRALV